MSRIAVFLADGFEEIEGLTVVDICRRCGIEVDTISVMGRKEINGSHGIIVQADLLLSDSDFSVYDMLVLPGGKAGTENLESCIPLMEQLDAFYKAGKYIAAICAAPSIFGHRGFLKGRRACSYPDFESHLDGAEVTEGPVAVDGKVLTSRGMGTSIDFALAIVETFCGREVAVGMAQKIVYTK